MSNIYQNIQLDRIATAIENGDAGGKITIDVTSAGDMQGATATAAGVHGLVPAPAAGDENKILSGAGTWIDSGSGVDIGDLENVTITSPISGESLKYNGSKWVNGNVMAELPDFIEETSGSIVTVNASERPAKSLKVAITPVQSGSGDPSPDNIRPISGWTGCNVRIETNNLYDSAKNKTRYYINSTGEEVPNSNWDITDYIEITKASYIYYEGITNAGVAPYSAFYNANKTLISTFKQKVGTNEQAIPNNAHYVRFPLSITTITPDYTTFKLTNGTTYTITFPTEAGTVYGGTIDVVNGTLTVTKANIASYDGETLPGAWISDRDVYAEGTTPTTGAQVVYDLDTPITYHLTPTVVQMLLGTNNIWADTGEVKELKYIPQTYNDFLEEVTGGYGITTNGAPVETGITWDGNPVKCFCFRNYNLSLNAQADNNLSWYGFSDTVKGLFKVDCIVQKGSNTINVTPHVHYDGNGWLRGRYDTSENFTSGTGYIFMYYY